MKRLKTLGIPFLPILVTLVVAGCASCGRSVEDFPRTEIDYSSGGGVSGMSSGFSILADGTVSRWTGRSSQHDREERIGKLDPEEHAELLEQLYAISLDDLRQQETGNMTTALRIVRDDEALVFTWAGLHQRKEDVPEALRPLRDLIWRRIERVQAENP